MKKITLNEVERRLRFDNPWWEERGQVDLRYREWPRRDYFAPFLRLCTATEVRRAVVLLGPRRVGKTVMLQQLVHELGGGKTILYVSLDTPTYLDLSLEQLFRLFLQANGLADHAEVYALFDEVQYRPDWEVHLKSLVDSYPHARFVASGSAAAALRLKSRESGAGRFTDFVLPPLTFAEFLAFTGQVDGLITFTAEMIDGSPVVSPHATDIDCLNAAFVDYLNFGGFPEAALSKDIQQDPARYLRSDIIDKVMLRDLPSLYGVTDIQELYRLFTTLAHNTGEEVSLEALSTRSGVAKNTLRRYLEYLEAAFLIRMVSRVDESGRRFRRQTHFKVYLTNPSIRAALFGPVGPDDDAMGALAETAVYSQYMHFEGFEHLAYARWGKGGKYEVDLVFVPPTSDRPVWALEVKWSDRYLTRPGELAGLIEFSRSQGLKRALATTRTGEAQETVGGIEIVMIPCATFCYEIGHRIALRQHMRALASTLRG